MSVPPPVEATLVGQAGVTDPATRLATVVRRARRSPLSARAASHGQRRRRPRPGAGHIRPRRHARQFDSSRDAGEEAWLVRVLVNLQRDRWRRTAVRARHDAAHAPAAEADPGSDQESALIARTTVWRALERLPPRRRAILVLHELEGLDARAIASLLHITPITVRWHLSRGRRDLASLVKATRGECA